MTPTLRRKVLAEWRGYREPPAQKAAIPVSEAVGPTLRSLGLESSGVAAHGAPAGASTGASAAVTVSAGNNISHVNQIGGRSDNRGGGQSLERHNDAET